MLSELKRIIILIAPLIVLAVFIGESLDERTAALAMGLIIGIMAAGVAGLLWLVARDTRANRDRQSAHHLSRAERGYLSNMPITPPAIDAEWREITPDRAQPATPSAPAIEPPSRALAPRGRGYHDPR